MLKGINSLLTPDVLYALCAMGHGDEVVLVDAHYPTDTAARSSVFGSCYEWTALIYRRRSERSCRFLFSTPSLRIRL